MNKNVRTLIKYLALIVGFYILYKSTQYISWDDLKGLFYKGGTALFAVLLVFPVSYVFHNLGLFWLFPDFRRRSMGFSQLYFARFIGEALNRMTPFVDIGGEPLKIALIAKRGVAPMDEAITAVCVSRVVYVLTEIIFICAGTVALWFYDSSSKIFLLASIALAISSIHLALLVTAQTKGLIQMIPGIAKRLNIKDEEDLDGKTFWDRADDALRYFYKRRKRDFFTAVFWQEIGWITISLENYMVFRILGFEITFFEAFLIQSLLQAVKTVSFYIPGNLGAQEGGLAYLASQIGFTATGGFALSLIKRFRLLVLSFFGLIFWTFGSAGRHKREGASK